MIVFKKAAEKVKNSLTKFSFGSSSAIITNLALMAGLHSSVNAKASIIGGILIIALADNISDSFGIHIFQECENVKTHEVWMSTMMNFISRVIVSLSFVLLMLLLPLQAAIMASIVWGLLLLAWISYIIARYDGTSVVSSIVTHIVIAVSVIILSNITGDFLIRSFK